MRPLRKHYITTRTHARTHTHQRSLWMMLPGLQPPTGRGCSLSCGLSAAHPAAEQIQQSRLMINRRIKLVINKPIRIKPVPEPPLPPPLPPPPPPPLNGEISPEKNVKSSLMRLHPTNELLRAEHRAPSTGHRAPGLRATLRRGACVSAGRFRRCGPLLLRRCRCQNGAGVPEQREELLLHRTTNRGRQHTPSQPYISMVTTPQLRV